MTKHESKNWNGLTNARWNYRNDRSGVVGNGSQAAMKDEMFVMADGVGGHLEYVGHPLGVDGSVHCWRREVRETLAGFEVYDVRFRKSQGRWREASRDKSTICQSKGEPIQAVKDHERGWWEAEADDLEEQRERAHIEAGRELGREPSRYCRDTVDMVYDDGLTLKEALKIERQRRHDHECGMDR